MFTPRNAILAALVVMLFSLTWSVVNMLAPPDSGGRANDSYGTRYLGQRGLFETLAELGIPVARSLAPPGRSLPRDTTLLLWDPQPGLVSHEPRYLHELAQWVRDGGRLIVTPPLENRRETLRTLTADVPVEDAATTLWECLGIDDQDITISRVQPASAAASAEASHPPKGGSEADGRSTQPVIVDVEASGSLAALTDDVRQLAAPFDNLRTISVEDGESLGRISCRDRRGQSRDAVISFPVGAGEVVLVGDSRLFSNELLARADNSVLAVRLLTGDRARVEFNEFYHGLSVRGNPLWLFTRRGYALVAAVVVAVIAVVTWRSAVLLGPPLTAPEPSRRTVAEYIDAMSQFLDRGRRTRRQLSQAVLSGTLRHIAAEFDLTHDREDARTVAAVVERRDPERAVRLRQAIQAVDAVLAKHDKATEKETVLALRQLQECVSARARRPARI